MTSLWKIFHGINEYIMLALRITVAFGLFAYTGDLRNFLKIMLNVVKAVSQESPAYIDNFVDVVWTCNVPSWTFLFTFHSSGDVPHC